MCGPLDITKSCDDCPIKDTRFCKKNNRDGKRYEETPSEKIMKLALERDKVYDRCKSLSAEIKEAKENNQDYNFLTIQFNHMDDYKKVLGDQIKKLIDET